MPLVSRHDTGNATLLLWKITEGEDELRAKVTDGDRASADRFRSPQRRLEHLAWRAALRTILPEGEVMYDDACAPFVDGAGRHIGVSHSGDCAVVIVADGPCAVDVERLDRNLDRSRDRFLSAKELLLSDCSRADFAIAVWCAKEALYKYSGRRELDFLKDLEIIASDIENGTMTGRCCDMEPIRLRLLNSGKYLIVYIL